MSLLWVCEDCQRRGNRLGNRLRFSFSLESFHLVQSLGDILVSVNRSARCASCLRCKHGSTQHGLLPSQLLVPRATSLPLRDTLCVSRPSPALQPHLLWCTCAPAITNALRFPGRALVFPAATPFHGRFFLPCKPGPWQPSSLLLLLTVVLHRG